MSSIKLKSILACLDQYFHKGFTVKQLGMIQAEILGTSPTKLEELIYSFNPDKEAPYSIVRILNLDEYSPVFSDNGDYLVVEFNVEVKYSDMLLIKGVQVQFHKNSETIKWATYLDFINEPNRFVKDLDSKEITFSTIMQQLDTNLRSM